MATLWEEEYRRQQRILCTFHGANLLPPHSSLRPQSSRQCRENLVERREPFRSGLDRQSRRYSRRCILGRPERSACPRKKSLALHRHHRCRKCPRHSAKSFGPTHLRNQREIPPSHPQRCATRRHRAWSERTSGSAGFLRDGWKGSLPRRSNILRGWYGQVGYWFESRPSSLAFASTPPVRHILWRGKKCFRYSNPPRHRETRWRIRQSLPTLRYQSH